MHWRPDKDFRYGNYITPQLVAGGGDSGKGCVASFNAVGVIALGCSNVQAAGPCR
jgi:hypothetical protein